MGQKRTIFSKDRMKHGMLLVSLCIWLSCVFVITDFAMGITPAQVSLPQQSDLTGVFLGKFGSNGTGGGQFQSPKGIAVNSTGQVYVTDNSNHRVQIFSSNGTFLGKFGSQGSGDGQFQNPSGIAVNSTGQVYVTDCYNHRVQIFSSTGTFLGKFGSQGAGDGQFEFPNGIAVNSTGYVYVADRNNYRVQIFSSTGTFLGKIESIGAGDGQFHSPAGIAVNSTGRCMLPIKEIIGCRSSILIWGLPAHRLPAHRLPAQLLHHRPDHQDHQRSLLLASW
jgi:NHL repeat